MTNDNSNGEFGLTAREGKDTRGPDSSKPLQPIEETVAGGILPRDSGAIDPLIHARLGNMVIESSLGGGSFGQVYLARDEKLGRRVAVKLLRDALDPQHRKLFEREARAIAALSRHPSIVQIFEWGEYNGHAYFALEYVESSAWGLFNEYPEGLPVAMAIQIALQAAEGLAYAHKQGILHRDIKPANILIDKETRKAKLADFGLAQVDRPDSTQTLTVSGSPAYMSPEQTAGGRVDARSDVFSLGITLYELLSNKRPFKGQTASEVIANIQQGNRISLREHRSDLPDGIVEVVEKATAHAPSERFQSADDFAVQLRLILRSLSRSGTVPKLGGTPSRKAKRRSWMIATGAVAAALLIVLSLTHLSQFGVPPVGGPTVALAAAKQSLDQDNAAEAERLYTAFLQQSPGDAQGLYGLGYALYRQGKFPDASRVFGQIPDESVRIDGIAAVAYGEEREKARPKLEQAESVACTPYPRSLLASLDIGEQKYEDAARLLNTVDEKRFAFAWQHAAYLQALGQACYHLGDYEKAADVFERLSQSSKAADTSFAAYYVEMARDKLDEKRRAAVIQQADEIRKLFDQAPPEPAQADVWTSRPLRFFILPATVVHCPLALETGLADVLPRILGKTLQETSSLQLVNREHLQDLLEEQQLSALLSSKDKLQLCRLLGARLVIECRFERLFQKDFLAITIVDAETTRAIPMDDISLTARIEPQGWLNDLAQKLRDTIADAYPVRGKITADSTRVLADIGASVGAKVGMEFAVATEPDLHHLLPNRIARIAEITGEGSATVALEGLQLADIPPTGLFITERKAAAHAAP